MQFSGLVPAANRRKINIQFNSNQNEQIATIHALTINFPIRRLRFLPYNKISFYESETWQKRS